MRGLRIVSSCKRGEILGVNKATMLLIHGSMVLQHQLVTNTILSSSLVQDAQFREGERHTEGVFDRAHDQIERVPLQIDLTIVMPARITGLWGFFPWQREDEGTR